LTELQPDIVKLDRVVVYSCYQGKTRFSINLHMLRVCQDLNIKLVAKRRETKGELASVQPAAVRVLQGFYLASPAFEATGPVEQICRPTAMG